MKILFISPKSPGDRSCGGGVRSGFILRALQELGDVVVVPGILDGPRFKVPWYLTIPMLFSAHLMDRLYKSREAILGKMGLEGESFDCVVVRYVGPMNSNAAWKIAPCFLDVDDLPSQSVATLRSNEPYWKRMLLIPLLRIWQSRLIRRSTAFWVCNANHMLSLKKLGKCSLLPNVAEPPPNGYVYERIAPLQFLTVGGMSYRANSDGVDWFIENVWPRIVAEYPHAIYNVVGGGTPEALAGKWGKVKGVRLWGFVERLDERYEAANVVIAPIFAGSGTCIKVIEAALHGRKVFSTPFGARGLDAGACKRLGVSTCATADDFVAGIRRHLATSAAEKAASQVEIAHEAREMVSYRRFAAMVRDTIMPSLMKQATT